MSGPDGDLAYTAEFADSDFERYASEMLKTIDAFVIGRKTYELFVDYWPKADGEDAEILNRLPKLVVSTTLESVEWNNAVLVKSSAADAVREFKDGFEKDVAVFGSTQLAGSLIGDRLIDEYRVLTTPFVIGSGRRAFEEGLAPHQLTFIRSEAWTSGSTAYFYKPIYN